MGAVRARAWSLLRRRVPATLALAALLGLAGAFSLAAFAGARRGERALPQFLAQQDPPHAAVFAFGGPGTDMAEAATALRELPYVVEASRLAPLLVAGPDVDGAGTPRRFVAALVVDRDSDALLGDPIVVDGRLPDESRPDEVAVDEEFVERTGVGLGGAYPLRTYRAERTGDTDPNAAPPDGPTTEVRVVGIVRYPEDLVPARLDQDNTAVDRANLYLTPAYWEEHGPDLATLFGVGVGVRLAGGDDLRRLRADVVRLLGDSSFVDEVDPEAGVAGIPLDGVRRAIDLESRALQGFAVLAAVAGLVLVGQALARDAMLEAADDPVLAAVGMTRGQRIAAAALRATVPAAVGAALAVLGAVALSPLTPIGVARRAELDRGVDVDGPVLLLGAAAIALAVCCWAAVTAWWVTVAAARAARLRPARASVLNRFLAGARLPVSARTGLTMALQRGRGGAAGLLRAAVVVTGVTVVAVTAAVVFVASLDRLDDRPEDYGVTWDVSVGEAGMPEQAAALEDRLAKNADVEAFAGITGEGLTVGDARVEVPALVLFEGTGAVGPRVAEGRAPRGPDEIAFGGQTMDELGLVVGDTVDVAVGESEAAPLRVTGEVLLNSAGLIDDLDNGEGALLPDPAQQRLVTPEDRALSFPAAYLVRLDPTADRAAELARFERNFPRTVVRPLTPSEVDNLTRVSGLPVVLAALVAVMGTGTIVHALVSSVRRRRRDLAMLGGLGFVRRQVSATLAWQATAFGVLALLVGIPLGVAVGRWSWRLTADALWVVSSPRVPVLTVALVAVATLAVVNAAALGALALARRTSLSAALTTE